MTPYELAGSGRFEFQSKKLICPKSYNLEFFNTNYLISKNHYLKIISI